MCSCVRVPLDEILRCQMAEQEKSSEKRHKKSEDVLLLAVSSFVELREQKTKKTPGLVCVWRRVEHNFAWDDVILSHSESQAGLFGTFRVTLVSLSNGIPC